MRASLIISVYKNTKNLQCILDALQEQTVKDFEIIVSEDCESSEMKDFLSTYKSKLTIIHSTQEDIGFRKNRALNRAIKSSSSDYIIFIDGDCVPNHRFIEQHLKNAEENTILIGRRPMLGPLMSKKLQTTNIKKFVRNYPFYFFIALKDNTTFFGEGMYRCLLRSKKARSILGCNFSCSKKALYNINGFDEDYENPGLGEDSDIDWRFKALGYTFKSVRNLAIVYHLDHPIIVHGKNQKIYDIKTKQSQIRCINGLSKSSI